MREWHDIRLFDTYVVCTCGYREADVDYLVLACEVHLEGVNRGCIRDLRGINPEALVSVLR